MKDKIIDFELHKFQKTADDEFIKFAEKIERFFNYSKSKENLFKRIVFTSKYLFQICNLTLSNNTEFKEIIINIFKTLIKELEENNVKA